MKIQKMLVSGDQVFIRRYQALFEAMRSRVDRLSYLYGDKPFESDFLNKLTKIPNKLIYLLSPDQANRSVSTAKRFITRSRQTERRIKQLKDQPDFVLHVFGMYSPFWEQPNIPYGIYLDYTAALAQRNLPTSQEFSEWRDCERLSYERAYHLFPMSELVKSSLVNDYGISPNKITAVGSFANRHALYEGEKKFGSKQILFNGSDFERKGGDLVLEAFKHIKKAIPEAKLVVIGKQLTTLEPGVSNPGKIESLEQMRQLFLETDLVLAPARCDPFPSFVIEAMNYGVPSIVSANDGMPEIVDHGINGIVVNQLNSELIAEKVINLLGDLPTLSSMSQRAREKVRTQLNRNIVADKIMQVLLRVNAVAS
ncbi:glycosyltransferase family 4 protein [Aerosakkonemataceae cyanobacterium BLCC-F50]|uniref:Glycosyltransferase family 4 protein n=1 Tax=Floridaenema flaviceps BLCC-F50 TaxID=3153642 RepID=A0ABV4XQY5_9CYAN